nr:hypothetical protein [Brevundimonas diminuta]
MSDLGITIFDPADALTSQEHIAAYIDLVAEEAGDDTGEVLKALGVAVRASGSAPALAIKAGLTLAELETALGEDGDPSFDTVLNPASYGVESGRKSHLN